MDNYDPTEDEQLFASVEPNPPNPLEALVLAHNENVHSAMLAWLLRTSEIPLQNRMSLLAAIAGPLEFEPDEVSTVTEWQNLDIRVNLTRASTDVGIVAIEHKIKAREHDDQLAKYDQALTATGERVLSKVFLTFTGDNPRNGNNWKPASYLELLNGLDRASAGCELRYLSDYRRLVQRLVAAHRLTIHCVDYTRHIFGDDVPDQSGLVSGFDEYVASCRLRTTLQRAWLGEIVRQTESDGWSAKTDETNGSGLIDFAKIVNVGDMGIRYGLQLQNWNLKAFAQPYPYPAKVSSAERGAVTLMLEQISRVFGVDNVRATSDRGRGFRSFSVENANDPSERYKVAFWVSKINPMLRTLAFIPTDTQPVVAPNSDSCATHRG